MRSDNSFRIQSEKRLLSEACSDGDVKTVKKLLNEGRSVHETTEEGESLLSLACSAGFYELSQVLIAMNANVEDRGIRGDCTPLMEAASAGHVDIVSLLIAHGADVNAQSTSGNTPLMYGCAGGHEEVVKVLLEAGANVEDHNENGHTPLMEAASAGHVSVAKILLEHGAGINTHSNEFKESALTLACYKGHLEMVRFLLEAGADQEHKTDEMHTALMEASMDGHVEVARLLLDSGAQVNMPTDSFESPLTLAACGGHVDLAMLLIERGANIEEVNDEGYTPLMEAAREGHEEMVALLLSQGANINSQTEETQETALTLACCGGFLEVADFLIKAGADIELGASTPLMEAAQEGHLDLVRYLLESNANVHAQTQTSDTALTYACENGHTDVVDILLQFGADLEHESEGGRTPLMKACRAGHLCTVQFLVSKRADVNRQTTNNDHTSLSLACAGGHLSVVELLLAQSADPFHKLKDNSTMLIEAAKGGHTSVVQLLLDYPHSIMINSSRDMSQSTLVSSPQTTLQPLQISTQYLIEHQSLERIQTESALNQKLLPKHNNQKSLLKKSRSIPNFTNAPINSVEMQQVCPQPLHTNTILNSSSNIIEKNIANESGISNPNINVLASSSQVALDFNNHENRKIKRHEQILHKQQILEELQRVERELQIKGAGHLYLRQPGSSDDDLDLAHANHLNRKLNFPDVGNVINVDGEAHHTPATQCRNAVELINPPITETANYQNTSNITSALSFYKGFQQANKYYIEGFKEGIKLEKQRMLKEVRSLQETQLPLPLSPSVIENISTIANNFPNTSSISLITVPASSASMSSIIANPSSISNVESSFSSNTVHYTGEVAGSSQPITSSSKLQISQNTAISDRPKVKAISKKDNKSVRKTVHGMVMNKLQQQHMALMAGLSSSDFQKFLEKTRPHCVQQVHQLQQLNQQLQLQLDQVQTTQTDRQQEDSDTIKLHLQGPCPFFIDPQYSKTTTNDEVLKLGDGSQIPIDEAVNIFESISFDGMSNDEADKVEAKENGTFGNEEKNSRQIINEDSDELRNIQEPDSFMTSLSAFNLVNTPTQNQTNSSILLQTSSCQPLQKQVLNAFEAGLSIGIQRRLSDDNQQTQLILQSNQIALSNQSISPTCTINTTDTTLSSNIEYSQHSSCLLNQVQVATQTQLPMSLSASAPLVERKSFINSTNIIKGKKSKHLLGHHVSNQQSAVSSSLQTALSSSSQNYQINPSAVSNNYPINSCVETYSSSQVPPAPFSCMDVDSETDSNHDTALTLACAGGHEELVELLLSRGADIEHRDKKGFTPLILAATAGHQKVVEILLNHGADLEAQSERTKDTPLSLACSGGRYEVVELLLNRSASKEHRNVSDYTPLSLAASGGYVNIIKLLLNHGAEINSRTGSKLGISPLMLAAMNGHTAAVKLLLDMGSDINAQIETNRNTALTLACFQGRHEVVSLLLDRKANVEHRAKTGLTPLMEAASGGYVEVGRVLLSKGADVNATPVPSSRDTALTIAADKGHCRFVELLLSKGTQVEVKNKKGNSPLWLAANGGHLNVVDLLYHAGADIDSQDNRKVSCLMAAFRKGHIKIVKWMVNHVTQFPSDQEMTRYVATINDKELLERCQECVRIIRAAKETQAAKANKNATILLEELDMEKTREESKKAAAARRRERKKKKKLEKKEEKRKLHAENKRNETVYKVNDIAETRIDESGTYKDNCDLNVGEARNNFNDCMNISHKSMSLKKEERDSNSYADNKERLDTKIKEKKKEKKKKKFICSSLNATFNEENSSCLHMLSTVDMFNPTASQGCFTAYDINKHPADRDDFEATGSELCAAQKGKRNINQLEIDVTFSNSSKLLTSTSPKYFGKRDEGWKEVVRKGQIEDSGKFMNSPFRSKKVSVPPNAISRVIGRGGSNINSIRTATGAHIEVEKQSKSLGERIITIKGSFEATKQAHELILALIKNPDIDIIQLLSKSKLPCNVNSILLEKPATSLTAPKTKIVSTKLTSGFPNTTANEHLTKPSQVTSFSSATYILPLRSPTGLKVIGAPTNRSSVSRFSTASDKKVLLHSIAPSNTKTTMSYTNAIMTAGRSSKVIATNVSETFAAKLLEINMIPSTIDYSNYVQSNKVPYNATNKHNSSSAISSLQSTIASNSQINQNTSANNLLESDAILSSVPVFTASSTHYSEKFNSQSVSANLETVNLPSSIINTTCTVVSTANYISLSNSASITSQSIKTPQASAAVNLTSVPISNLDQCPTSLCNVPLEYSLFNDTFSKVTQQSMWGSKEHEIQKNINFATIAGARISENASVASPNKFIDRTPIEVDASKAPGYRGTLTCSPTSNQSSNLNCICNNSTSDDRPNSPVKNTVHAENVQLADYTNDNGICGISKPPVNLTVARPHSNKKNVNENVASAAPFTRLAHCENMKPLENSATSHEASEILLMSSQSNLEVNMFNLNEDNSNFDNESSTSNLMKTVSNKCQTSTQSMISIQRHIQNYPQTVSPSAIVTTTISMSRLNPRAPDFSSSLHLGNKQQMTTFNTSTPIQPNVFPVISAQPSTSIIHSSNLTMLGGFPYNKYQAPFLRQPHIGVNNQNHWPFVATSNYTHQDQVISQANYSDHIIGITSPSSNIDMINLENGCSVPPVMSLLPSSSSQEISQMQFEDRKPRPIGTERTWKNYSMIGPGGDTDNINWILNHEKTADSWSGVLPNMDTDQLFGSNTTFNRISPNETDSHKITEASFQGNRFGS